MLWCSHVFLFQFTCIFISAITSHMYWVGGHQKMHFHKLPFKSGFWCTFINFEMRSQLVVESHSDTRMDLILVILCTLIYLVDPKLLSDFVAVEDHQISTYIATLVSIFQMICHAVKVWLAHNFFFPSHRNCMSMRSMGYHNARPV